MTTITQAITALPDGPDPATDDPDTFSTKAAARVLAEETLVTEINTWAGQANTVAGEVSTNAGTATTQAGIATTQAGIATTQAAAAAGSAASALNAPGTNATSTTSLTIGTGAKSLTIQTGKAIAVGQSVTIAYTTTPTTRMSGAVTSYDSGTGALTVSVDTISGSGTQAAWTVSLGAVPETVDAVRTWATQQTFKELKDTVYTITDGAAFEIDPANGAVQTITLGASRTPAATNFEAGQTVLLGVDDGSAYSITWTTVAPTWVKSGGTASAPTLATSGWTWILLWKVGTTMYAAEVGQP